MLESDNFFSFGKYKGKSLRYVLEHDSPYFAWCYYNAPQFKKMIETFDEDFIECIEICARNEMIRQHNKLIYHCLQPMIKYIKNPNFFKYFKEPIKKPLSSYSCDEYLDNEYDDGDDDIFEQEDNYMNNNF